MSQLLPSPISVVFLRFSLALVASFLWCLATARAEDTLNIDVELGTIDNWTFGFSNFLDGCVAKVGYTDQTTLWIGFSSKSSRSFIAFTNPNWRSIEPGKRYPGEMRLKQTWTLEFVGFERSTEKGIWGVDLRVEFLEDLQASAEIRLLLNQRSVASLSLGSSRQAIATAFACHQKYVEESEKSKPEEPKTKGEKYGTGFFVSASGHVITNNHVVDGCSMIYALLPGAREVNGDLVAKDKMNDLALIKTTLPVGEVPGLLNQIKVGESVFIFGFPYSGLLSSSGNFTAGTVAALTGIFDDSRHLQISAPVQKGNSGGPLIDKYGNVVGIVVAKLSLEAVQTLRDIPENVNFAIKAGIAVGFLTSARVSPNQTTASRELSPAEIADRASKFTVRMRCLVN